VHVKRVDWSQEQNFNGEAVILELARFKEHRFVGRGAVFELVKLREAIDRVKREEKKQNATDRCHC
jgi:hypothetical protein